MTQENMMEHFDFREPAEIFVGGGRFGKRSSMTYRKFATGAEAVRFAIERQSAAQLATTVVEANDTRFVAAEILDLYQCAEYPFPRRNSA
jgi:hypothetical protein